MSYMSAFEYQSKGSISISDLNRLRKYIKFGTKDIENIRPIFREIVQIFKEKNLHDIDILLSFNSRSSDGEKSTIFQLYKTIQKNFQDDNAALSQFVENLEKVINGESIDNENKKILIENIAKIITEIDTDIATFRHNEESDSLFISRGF